MHLVKFINVSGKILTKLITTVRGKLEMKQLQYEAMYYVIIC